MKRFIKSLIILKFVFCFSQNDGGNNTNFNSGSEINNLIKLPKSPEAAAFEKYGNTPVNLYTGTPEISIPLHALLGREINIPLSLSYDASGIKVNQIATNVGLGWSLNMGGRITRISCGIPDDILNHPYEDTNNAEILYYKNHSPSSFSSEWDLSNYLQFMIEAKDGQRDTLLDLYSLNVLGVSDYIVRDLDTKLYHTLLNPNIDVTMTSMGWKVVIEDGTTYFFDDKEYTEVLQLDSGGDSGLYFGTSTSSWLLNKVISKNKIDVFNFEYKNYKWQNNVLSNVASKSYSYNTNIFPQLVNNGLGFNLNIIHNTSQMMPYMVSLNNEILVKFNYKSRDDITFVAPYQNGNALDEIVFYDFKTSNLNPTYSKKIQFNHDYFGVSTNKRLKLNNVIFYQNSLINGKKYSFEYIDPNNVPSITSNSQDYLGLFNNQNNPDLVSPVFNSDGLALTGGANRLPSFDNMIIGTLNKIIYPTKGYTSFVYEQNKVANNTLFNEQTSIIEEEISYLNTSDFCISFLPQYPNHSFMNSIISNNSFDNNCYTYSNGFFIGSNKSSFMRITEPTMTYIEAEGEGVYLIQKIDNCSVINDVNDYCLNNSSSLPNVNITSYNNCLNTTNTIYYTGTSNSHPSNFIKGGFTYCAGNSNSILLQPGTYQITLWPRIEESCSIRLYKKTPLVIPQHWSYDSKLIDGFRIKEIKDYSATDVLATTKSYQYTEDFDSSKCSGIQLGFIKPYSSSFAKECAPERILETFSVGVSSYDMSPHIGYSSVIVSEKKGNETNGYEQTTYHVEASGIINNNGITSFNPNYRSGKIKEKKVYDKNKSVLKLEKNDYSEVDFYEENSFTFLKNSSSTFAYAKRPYWVLTYDIGYCQGTFQGIDPTLTPSWLGFGSTIQPDWESTIYGKHSYHLEGQNIYGRYGFLSKKESTTTLTGGVEMKQIETFFYDDHLRLTEKTTTGTNDVINLEQYEYHPNYPTNPEKITDVIISKDNDPIFHKNMVYSDYGTTANGIANMVSEIKTAKGTSSLESRLLFDYDSVTKNAISTVIPTGSTLTNDAYVSYIYGYNDRFPVAKLTGVKYSQIATTRISAIKDKTNVVCSTVNENALIAELNLLRTDFPNAQITTYTYNPVYGVNTETDAKGDLKHFAYDELGRLLQVKDKNGNILSENEYHYKN